jgi:class 3 adenylate cyclase
MVPKAKAPASMLIVFIDLSRFDAQSQHVADSELAETIDTYYVRVANAIQGAGGTVVKFIGDATLAVFPEKAVDAAVAMLLELKPSVDEWMTEKNWECRFAAKAHFGEVIAGQFGPEGSKRFDVIGRAVNTTARLQSIGITLSVDTFRKLSPELQKNFKQDTGTVTYVLREDPKPTRRKSARSVWA